LLVGLFLLVAPVFLLDTGEYTKPSALAASAGGVALASVGLAVTLDVTSFTTGRRRTALAGTSTLVGLFGVVGIFVL
jgi:hypothetical protein